MAASSLPKRLCPLPYVGLRQRRDVARLPSSWLFCSARPCVAALPSNLVEVNSKCCSTFLSATSRTLKFERDAVRLISADCDTARQFRLQILSESPPRQMAGATSSLAAMTRLEISVADQWRRHRLPWMSKEISKRSRSNMQIEFHSQRVFINSGPSRT